MSVDYTDADTFIHGVLGEGKNERYSINLYDTWVNENDHYYDLVIRGGRINNDYDTKSIFTNGIYDIGSKYHKYFGNVSGEYSFKYELENGWYLKPQTQLQLSYIKDVNYTSKSGIKVERIV